MTSTLTIGRLTFSVTRIEDERDDKGFRYELRGPRGAHYATLRNKPNPDMMFVVNIGRGRKAGPFENAWLTDVSGELATF